jgi:hypothetical protein
MSFLDGSSACLSINRDENDRIEFLGYNRIKLIVLCGGAVTAIEYRYLRLSTRNGWLFVNGAYPKLDEFRLLTIDSRSDFDRFTLTMKADTCNRPPPRANANSNFFIT